MLRGQTATRQFLFALPPATACRLLNASMDAVLRIYAPCKAGELARVVKPGGILMTISPELRHLYHS